jgi:predicted secreted Zn-dependent protease
MRIWSAVAGLVMAGCLASTAVAKPVYTTKYSYYAVNGRSAEEVYQAMLSRGPKVNGVRAYAATTATTTQGGHMAQGGSCKIQNYKLSLEFVIKLPKIRNEKVLSAGDRKRWQQFASFLKKHEEHHRTIWLGCAAELERRVKAIKVKSCDATSRRAQALWDKIRAACSRKHDAFDTAEQKRLMQHPFVKMVYDRRSRSTRAASLW